MRFLILGRSIGRIERKKPKKKNHNKSWNSWPWYPRTTLKVNIHIFGSTKCTIYCEKCSCFCFCFSLCCYYAHFSDEKNYFLKMPKMWVGRTMVNGEKKRGWPYLFAWLAQLGECRSAEREVVCSNPGWTNTQGL